MISRKEISLVRQEVGENWRQNRCSSMAAAIAYRSLFSLIPLVYLLVLVFSVSSSLVGGLAEAQNSEMLHVIAADLDLDLIDADLVELVNHVVREQLLANVVVVLIGLVILIVGATSMFNELIISVNAIWGVRQGGSLKYILSQRLIAFGLIVGLGVLAILTMMIRAILWTVDDFILDLWVASDRLGYWLGWLIVPVLILVIVMVMNKYLPKIKLSWRDVWWSSVVVTPMFLLGQVALGWYFGRTDMSDKFGSFGAFVVFMLWVYYSSMILLMSAQLTRVYVEGWGSRKV